ncbi:MAG: 4'-phosphopantetheinyl transferase family protein [Bdellovibrionales bacterium]
MDFFQRIFDSVVSVVGSEVFYAEMQPDWGSQHPQHRDLIRRALNEYLQREHPEEINESILDLETPPVLKKLRVSISHTQGLGGFVVSARSAGLDIEQTRRIRPEVLERISSEDERRRCPRPELLWTAKEAVFKCSSQYVMITQISIDSWFVSQNETFQFASLGCVGFAACTADFSFALALKNT